MKFKVKAKGKDLPVVFRFGSARDFRVLANWKSIASDKNNPLVQDALEYRSLAGKRWRTYAKSRRTVTGSLSLQNAIRKDPHCEAVFILIAHARWHTQSTILGFCFCRRTWCHHMIIDFAASHPNAIRLAGGDVRGVGSGMLYSLVSLANELRIKLIWGEATLNSVEFYKKALNQPRLTDHFFIKGRVFNHCLRQHGIVKTT